MRDCLPPTSGKPAPCATNQRHETSGKGIPPLRIEPRVQLLANSQAGSGNYTSAAIAPDSASLRCAARVQTKQKTEKNHSTPLGY